MTTCTSSNQAGNQAGYLKKAQELRKQKKYAEALELYQDEWNNNPEGNIAAGVINCLRGLERFDEAEEVALNALPDYPKLAWLKTELAWTLYLKYIKPVHTPDRELFLEKAEQIMELTNDFLPRKLTAFKVTDVLAHETRPDWYVIRRWLERIRGVMNEPPTIEPGKKMSDKKKWYFKYTKALEKLGDYEECRQYCGKALRVFKNNYFFRHRAAKCALEMSNFKRAFLEYDNLMAARDEWFLHFDLAELYKAQGNLKEAEQHVIIAILRCEEPELKIRAYLVWAQILAELDPNAVWIPLQFYKLFRFKMGWPLHAEAEELMDSHPVPEEEAVEEIPLAVAQTQRLARRRYKEYIPRRIGAIKNLREKFGFVKGTDGKDYFFSRTNLRGNPKLGLKVTFRARKAYDKKKKKKSPEAYDIEPLMLGK